mmetsp:Transcript_78579/g.168386  ORF Transcript_78579/g.168386 Transcript_78579/m.168386 type:complete len:258 (-) Transcript_78579:611-1384(-)
MGLTRLPQKSFELGDASGGFFVPLTHMRKARLNFGDAGGIGLMCLRQASLKLSDVGDMGLTSHGSLLAARGGSEARFRKALALGTAPREASFELCRLSNGCLLLGSQAPLQLLDLGAKDLLLSGQAGLQSLDLGGKGLRGHAHHHARRILALFLWLGQLCLGGEVATCGDEHGLREGVQLLLQLQLSGLGSRGLRLELAAVGSGSLGNLSLLGQLHLQLGHTRGSASELASLGNLLCKTPVPALDGLKALGALGLRP